MNPEHSYVSPSSALALSLVLAAWAPIELAQADSDTELNEIVVTATLRAEPAIDLPASVTVLDAQTLRDAGRTNLEDVLGLIPNLNWAGDTSLPDIFSCAASANWNSIKAPRTPRSGS